MSRSRHRGIVGASGRWGSLMAVLAIVLSASVQMALADASASHIDLADGSASSYRSVSARFARLSFTSDGSRSVTDFPWTQGTGRSQTTGDGGADDSGDDKSLPPGDDRNPDPRPRPKPDDGEEYDDSPLFVVTLSSSRSTAGQGDEIVYTIRGRNFGATPMSNVILRAHVPAGTTMTSGGGCESSGVNVATPCIPTLTPDEDGHLSQLFLALPADSQVVWTLSVRVNLTTPNGTVLSQHAHATADDSPLVSSSEVTVIVV